MDHWQNTEQREDKYGDHGGDHQQYLQQKRRKLDDQRRRTQGTWFAGCVVWIDGLTDPPADDLEQLVVAGGGLVCDSRDRRATHIVMAAKRGESAATLSWLQKDEGNFGPEQASWLLETGEGVVFRSRCCYFIRGKVMRAGRQAGRQACLPA